MNLRKLALILALILLGLTLCLQTISKLYDLDINACTGSCQQSQYNRPLETFYYILVYSLPVLLLALAIYLGTRCWSQGKEEGLFLTAWTPFFVGAFNAILFIVLSNENENNWGIIEALGVAVTLAFSVLITLALFAINYLRPKPS